MILNGHIGPVRLITAEVSAWRSTAHCHYMVQVGLGRWTEVFRLVDKVTSATTMILYQCVGVWGM